MSLRVDTLDPQNQTGDIVRENVQSPEIFFLKEHTGKAAVISTSNIPFYQFEKEEWMYIYVTSNNNFQIWR